MVSIVPLVAWIQAHAAGPPTEIGGEREAVCSQNCHTQTHSHEEPTATLNPRGHQVRKPACKCCLSKQAETDIQMMRHFSLPLSFSLTTPLAFPLSPPLAHTCDDRHACLPDPVSLACLSICHLPVSLSVCHLPLYLSHCLSVCLSVCHLPVSLPVFPSPAFLSHCQSVWATGCNRVSVYRLVM